VGLNFGVLFAWIVISLITIPIFQKIVRNQQVNQWKKQRAAEQAQEKSNEMTDGDSIGTQV
jgi:hypothetical protein